LDYFFDFILLLMIYFLFFYPKWRLTSKRTFLLYTAFYIYLVIVLYVTVMPFEIPLGATNNQYLSTAIFMPFNDLIQGYEGAEQDIILNILMMIPFGFLFPLIRISTIYQTVFITFLFSGSIESYQLLNGWLGTSTRIFDVTDIMTNTFGGFIGYVLCSKLKVIATINVYNKRRIHK
jgi:glycopeptide antibiotics resistance protein